MKLSAKTETGKTRTENQDDYRGAIMPGGICWAVICDGMGGANGGKLASALAVSCAEKACMEFFGTDHTETEIRSFLNRTVSLANMTVYSYAEQHPEYSGMGTTIVMAVVCREQCILASVGDSRAYLLHKNELMQLTHDHSVVQQMVDNGLLNENQAAEYPYKNVITRAVGVQKELDVDLFTVSCEKADVLMLCTDGLYNALDVREMIDTVNTVPFYQVPDCLIDKVLSQPEQDNATVLLVEI